MSKYAMNVVTMILAFLTFNASAQTVVEKQIETVKMFPVAQVLKDNNEQVVSVIDTGVVTDASGETAKGPHDVIIELDSTSDISVVIGGQTLAPGDTATINVNFSEIEHRLVLPVYPATGNIAGHASYSIRIPDIKISLCPEGYTDSGTDCYHIDYEEITYACPVDFQYAMDIKNCRKYEYRELVGQCPEGYSEDTSTNTCTTLKTEAPVDACPPEYTRVNDTCEYKSVVDMVVCPVGYTAENGQCAKVVSTYEAVYPCPATYSLVNGSCEKKSTSTGVSLTCPNNYMINNQCYPNSGGQFVNPDPYYYESAGYGSYVFYLKDEFKDDIYQLDPGTGEHDCPASHPHQHDVYTCTTYPGAPVSTVEQASACDVGLFYFGSVYGASGGTHAVCYDNTTVSSPEYQCDTYGHFYNPTTGVCENTTTVTAGYYCGSTLNDNSTCHNYSYTSQGQFCPAEHDYDSAEDKCINLIDTQPVSASCSDGYELSSDETLCTYNDTIQIEMTCPSGYLRTGDGTVCEKVIDALAGECPPDYVQNTATNSCELNLSEAAVQECPLGYVETEGVCEQKDSVDIEACPSGYTELDGGQCQKLESSTAASNCPSGYTFNSSESVCEKPYPGEDPESEFCASSEVEYLGECFTKHNEDIWHGGDTRYVQDSQNPNLFRLHGHYYTNMEQCGSYFPYDGGPWDDWSSYRLCYHNSSPDMPPLLIGATGCYSGQKVTVPGAGYFTCIDTSEDPKPKSGSCFNAGYTYNTSSGMCEMPPDTASVGQYCGSEESETPPYCHTFSYVDQGINCPAGYDYDNTENLCINLIDTQPLTITCPVDYSLSGDNQTCTYNDVIQIDMTCPSGYLLAGDGTVCKKDGGTPAETVDATANCPADYEYIGNLSCQKTIIESAAYECPEGYQPSESLESCEKETRMPYVY